MAKDAYAILADLPGLSYFPQKPRPYQCGGSSEHADTPREKKPRTSCGLEEMYRGKKPRTSCGLEEMYRGKKPRTNCGLEEMLRGKNLPINAGLVYLIGEDCLKLVLPPHAPNGRIILPYRQEY